jgi:hypothetical protein
METIPQLFFRGVEHLIGRFSGPLNFRLFVMPTVATVLAVRAGLRDAREGNPPYMWSYFLHPAEWKSLFRSGLKDFGKIFVMAVLLDSIYQIWVLRAFYPGQLVIVAVVCAIVPYVIVRGSATRLTNLLYRKRNRRADSSAVIANSLSAQDDEIATRSR